MMTNFSIHFFNPSHIDLYIRLIVALFFGFIIGLERAIKKKSAGIRTHTLVCLGSCLIMVLSTLNEGQYRDPMRLAAQVVSGIGFIGAGVIWTDRRNTKHGLTTAANLWITSGIGLVIGFGMYDIAILAGILIFLAMNLPKIAEKIGLLPEIGPNDKDGDSDGE
jgi:putative Mg2+ transporter-C (MgtC) family protein